MMVSLPLLSAGEHGRDGVVAGTFALAVRPAWTGSSAHGIGGWAIRYSPPQQRRSTVAGWPRQPPLGIWWKGVLISKTKDFGSG